MIVIVATDLQRNNDIGFYDIRNISSKRFKESCKTEFVSVCLLFMRYLSYFFIFFSTTVERKNWILFILFDH